MIRVAPALRGYSEQELLRFIRDGRAYLQGDTIVPTIEGASVPPLSNSAEGGTDTTAVTTGNSGGASGNAFDTVTLGTGATILYSATQKRGNLSIQVNQPTTPASTYCLWSAFGTITTTVYFRMYIWVPTSGQNGFFAVRNQAGSACAYFLVNSSGKVVGQNAAGAAQITSTTTIPNNAWFRLEASVLPSTTVGQVSFRLFVGANVDGTTADESQTSAANCVLTADVGQSRFSPNGVTSGFLPTGPYTAYMDDLGVSSTTWLGPSAAAAVTRQRQPTLVTGVAVNRSYIS